MLICVTGPESSGKSTLVQHLSQVLGIENVDEFARGYLEQRNGRYLIEDLDVIALGQLMAVKNAKRGGADIIVTDTYMLVPLIWSMQKFEKVSSTITELFTQNKPDYYFLCKPDLPWTYDPLRENPLNRDELFEVYLKHIEDSGVPYIVVERKGEERMYSAVEKVKQLIEKKIP